MREATKVWITKTLEGGIVEAWTRNLVDNFHGITYQTDKDQAGSAACLGTFWHLSREAALVYMETERIKRIGLLKRELIDRETAVLAEIKKLEMLRF